MVDVIIFSFYHLKFNSDLFRCNVRKTNILNACHTLCFAKFRCLQITIQSNRDASVVWKRIPTSLTHVRDIYCIFLLLCDFYWIPVLIVRDTRYAVPGYFYISGLTVKIELKVTRPKLKYSLLFLYFRNIFSCVCPYFTYFMFQ